MRQRTRLQAPITQRRIKMKEMLKLYRQLTEEQRKKIFTQEQIDCLNKADFFDRLFSDSEFYKAVETAICEAVYEELKA